MRLRHTLADGLIERHIPPPHRVNAFVGLRAKSLVGRKGRPQLLRMQCTFSIDSAVVIASPAGRIDTATCNEFKVALNTRLDETKAKHLVIDLAALEYLSSAGFREFFLIGRRMAREGGTLSVCALQPHVMELFHIAQFGTAYPIYDSREAAVAATRTA